MLLMDKHEYIDAFIAERFDCNNRELRNKVKPLLREVLRAAWDDIKDRLQELYVDLLTTSCYMRRPSHTILLHSAQMHNYSEYGIRYVLAHELAHFVLRHYCGTDRVQKEADECVEKWGFGQDMRIHRGNESMRY